MHGEEIITEKQAGTGFVTLNRPEAKNTFTVPLAEKLDSALKSFDDDPEVRVIVIRGAGKHFSTGIALDEFTDKTHLEYTRFLSRMNRCYHTIPNMKKLVIGSVQGYAVANGAGLAFACDLTIAAEEAKFGTTAVTVGLICLGPAVPMMRIIGRKKTLEMVLTGEIITAEEAARLGLINRVVPGEKLEEETAALAGRIAQKSPLALEIGKRGIYAFHDMEYHKSVDYSTELFASLAATEDAEEGVDAFLNKRSPKWKEK